MEKEIAQRIEQYKKMGLFKNLKEQLISFLDLSNDEVVLISLKLYPLRILFINNDRERYVKYLILTTERIIFVINRGYIFKEFFKYEEITDILVTKKWYVSGDLPSVRINTNNNTYEILFFTLLPYRKKIQGIVDCIKRVIPDMNIKIAPSYEENFVKEILSTKIKFK